MCGHACPNTQHDKFAISLQYLKKEVNDKVDFLPAFKHESLMQIGTMILMEMAKHSQNPTPQKVCNVYNISNKKL